MVKNSKLGMTTTELLDFLGIDPDSDAIEFTERPVVIDKVRMTANVKKDGYDKLLKLANSELTHNVSEGKDKTYTAYIRAHSDKGRQITVTFNHKMATIEFNPNNFQNFADMGIMSFVLSTVTDCIKDKWAFNRLDIAFNVYEDLSGAVIAHKPARTRDTWGNIKPNNGVYKIRNLFERKDNEFEAQTLYLGDKSSDTDLIRIYNKRRQLTERNLKITDNEKKHKSYYRIEFELHGKDVFKAILANKYDIFERLTIGKEFSFEQVAKAYQALYPNAEIKEKTITDFYFYIQAFRMGNPMFNKHLTKHYQDKAKALANKVQELSTDDTPQYQAQWNANSRTVARWCHEYVNGAKHFIKLVDTVKNDKPKAKQFFSAWDRLKSELDTPQRNLKERI